MNKENIPKREDEKCQIHQKILEMMCKDCGRKLCSKCLTEHPSDHTEYISLEDQRESQLIKKKYQQYLQDLQVTCKEIKNDCKKASEEEYDSISKNINLLFEQLIKILKQKKEAILKEVSTSLKILGKRVEKLKIQRLHISELTEKIETLLKIELDFETEKREFEAISKAIKEIQTSHFISVKKEFSKFQYNIDLQDLYSAIEKFNINNKSISAKNKTDNKLEIQEIIGPANQMTKALAETLKINSNDEQHLQILAYPDFVPNMKVQLLKALQGTHNLKDLTLSLSGFGGLQNSEINLLNEALLRMPFLTKFCLVIGPTPNSALSSLFKTLNNITALQKFHIVFSNFVHDPRLLADLCPLNVKKLYFQFYECDLSIPKFQPNLVPNTPQNPLYNLMKYCQQLKKTQEIGFEFEDCYISQSSVNVIAHNLPTASSITKFAFGISTMAGEPLDLGFLFKQITTHKQWGNLLSISPRLIV